MDEACLATGIEKIHIISQAQKTGLQPLTVYAMPTSEDGEAEKADVFVISKETESVIISVASDLVGMVWLVRHPHTIAYH